VPDGRFIGPCCRCKADMWLPTSLYDSARHSSKIVFFCPYGHEQVFSEGESEEIKLRRERDRLAQQIAERDDRIKSLIKAANVTDEMFRKLKGEKARLVKRTTAGTCPCCHRTFRQMALHMRNKHPDFKAQEVA
jgi:hypothetical protein